MEKDYKEIVHLPRWAYVDDEWCDLVLSADKIVDGVFYEKIIPEPVDEIDQFMADIMNLQG